MFTQDDKWLEALYRETFPHVARWVQRAGGDLDTAKDIFHDALIVYLEKYNNQTLEIRVSASAYLTGIAKILWIKQSKGNSRYVSLSSFEEQLSVPGDLYQSKQAAGTPLLERLKIAGTKCMELLQAFYYQRKSMQEIAVAFNYKTKRSATVQKYKCLEKVREQIKLSEVYEEVAA